MRSLLVLLATCLLCLVGTTGAFAQCPGGNCPQAPRAPRVIVATPRVGVYAAPRAVYVGPRSGGSRSVTRDIHVEVNRAQARGVRRVFPLFRLRR